MSESLTLTDAERELFGVVVFSESNGKKRIQFKQREGAIIDLSDMLKFKSFLEKWNVPQDQFLRAMRFYNEYMLDM